MIWTFGQNIKLFLPCQQIWLSLTVMIVMTSLTMLCRHRDKWMQCSHHRFLNMVPSYLQSVKIINQGIIKHIKITFKGHDIFKNYEEGNFVPIPQTDPCYICLTPVTSWVSAYNSHLGLAELIKTKGELNWQYFTENETLLYHLTPYKKYAFEWTELM